MFFNMFLQQRAECLTQVWSPVGKILRWKLLLQEASLLLKTFLQCLATEKFHFDDDFSLACKLKTSTKVSGSMPETGRVSFHVGLSRFHFSRERLRSKDSIHPCFKMKLSYVEVATESSRCADCVMHGTIGARKAVASPPPPEISIFSNLHIRDL